MDLKCQSDIRWQWSQHSHEVEDVPELLVLWASQNLSSFVNCHKNTFWVWLSLPRQPIYKPRLLLKLDWDTERSRSLCSCRPWFQLLPFMNRPSSPSSDQWCIEHTSMNKTTEVLVLQCLHCRWGRYAKQKLTKSIPEYSTNWISEGKKQNKIKSCSWG